MTHATRPFRFGIVGMPHGTGQEWAHYAQWAEEVGFDTLLSPEVPEAAAPLPALALAAASTTRLRIGTFVLASPLHPPALLAWEALTVAHLSGGRFELGIGTGLPRAAEVAASMGMGTSTATSRLAAVAETIDRVRERADSSGQQAPPALVAAGGPKAIALASTKADIVAVATAPLASAATIRDVTDRLRDSPGAGGAGVELSSNIFVVGDDMSPWVRDFVGADLAELKAADSLAILPGDPQDAAGELIRRRDVLGISYITVNQVAAQQFLPVMKLLREQMS